MCAQQFAQEQLLLLDLIGRRSGQELHLTQSQVSVLNASMSQCETNEEQDYNDQIAAILDYSVRYCCRNG
jgi:hypothetical protein